MRYTRFKIWFGAIHKTKAEITENTTRVSLWLRLCSSTRLCTAWNLGIFWTCVSIGRPSLRVAIPYKHFPLSKNAQADTSRMWRPMIAKCLYAPFRLNFWEWLLSFLGFISLGGDFTSNDSVLLIHVFSVFWDWHSTLVALPLDLILIVWFFTGVFLRIVFKTWRGSGLREMTWDHGFY